MMNTCTYRIIATILLLLTLNNSLLAHDVIRGCKRLDEKGDCALYSISIIELIANPEHYDGKRVRVMGFLHQEFESNALYLSEYHYSHALTKNALWIDTYLEDVNDHVVLIEGTYRAKNQGHRGMFSGALETITRSMVWPPQTTE